jgi:hypothetical protein
MINWRRSSFSNGGTACVEVGWRKSSSSGTEGNCVEVARAPLGVLVRDSKNTEGPVLAFGAEGAGQLCSLARHSSMRRG